MSNRAFMPRGSFGTILADRHESYLKWSVAFAALSLTARQCVAGVIPFSV
jgi:hypothetical protein